MNQIYSSRKAKKDNHACLDCLIGSKHLGTLFILLAIMCMPATLCAEESANAQPFEGRASLLPSQDQDSANRLVTSGGEVFHSTDNPVKNLRTVSIPESTTQLYLWEESLPGKKAQAYFAISPDGMHLKGRVRATTYKVRLSGHTFDPLTQKIEMEPILAARPHNTLHLVQFMTTPIEEFLSPITRMGGKVHRFLTDHAFVVEMSPETRNEVAKLPFVRWVGPYHPAYRVEEHLRSALTGISPALEEQRYSIMICERNHSRQENLASMIRDLGGVVHFTTPKGYRLEATLTHDQLMEVVHANETQYIDRWGGPGELDMNIVRQVGGADYVEGLTGWTGQGVRGEIFDTEVRTSHQEWLYSPIIHSSSSSGSYHGTSCFSINFARGIDTNARGLLPDGQGIFFRYSESTQFGGSKSRYDICQELIDPLGPYRAVFQTASVGSTRTPNYNTVSAEVDDYLFLYQVLSTQSQSNAGDQWSRPQAWAKNMVAVGGIYHYGTATRTDDHWGYGASIGPADDGRIKPDLAYFYDQIRAAYASSNSSYTDFSGTSAATPTTSGHFGLLFQMWHEQVWTGHGGGATVFDSRPHMATAKAMLVNSAYRYNWNVGGANSDITRYVQGWGTADVKKLYDRAGSTMIIDESDLIAPLDTNTYIVTVLPGETELNVTMVYTDLMGTVGAAHHRINDLSLKVTSPSSTVYWGNNGLTSGNFSTSGGSSNTLDTVENVFIQNPTAGDWTVQVLADEVVQDSHPETPALDADYGLVISGIDLASASYTLAVSPDPLIGGQSASFTVTNGDPVTMTYLVYSTTGTGSVWVPQLGVTLGIANPQLGFNKNSNGSGTTVWNVTVPNGYTGSAWLQACQSGKASNVVATSVQ